MKFLDSSNCGSVSQLTSSAVGATRCSHSDSDALGIARLEALRHDESLLLSKLRRIDQIQPVSSVSGEQADQSCRAQEPHTLQCLA